jgi:hypothetical protein
MGDRCPASDCDQSQKLEREPVAPEAALTTRSQYRCGDAILMQREEGQSREGTGTFQHLLAELNGVTTARSISQSRLEFRPAMRVVHA